MIDYELSKREFNDFFSRTKKPNIKIPREIIKRWDNNFREAQDNWIDSHRDRDWDEMFRRIYTLAYIFANKFYGHLGIPEDLFYERWTNAANYFLGRIKSGAYIKFPKQYLKLNLLNAYCNSRVKREDLELSLDYLEEKKNEK